MGYLSTVIYRLEIESDHINISMSSISSLFIPTNYSLVAMSLWNVQRVRRGPKARPSLALEMSLLCGKVLNGTQVLDTSQQQLQHPVTGSRGVSRQLMARQLNLVVGQATLMSPLSDGARFAQSSTIVLWVERHVKLLVLGILLKALLAVPGGVL